MGTGTGTRAAGAAASGYYISDSDVDNWASGATDAEKQAIIDRVEERIHKLTKDFFYPKSFAVDRDGNGMNRLNLNLIPNILSVSAIDISGVALSTSYYTHDKHSVFLDTTNITTEPELRYLLKRAERSCLFPRGMRNIHIVGTYGWTERLDIDNVSGTFTIGETITGGTSEATAIVNDVSSAYLKISGRSSTDFSNDETITGGTSTATADVNNASGAINDPPEDIKEACVICARYENNDVLYTTYLSGTESIGGESYSTKAKPLTGLREADLLLRPYVRKKFRAMVV